MELQILCIHVPIIPNINPKKNLPIIFSKCKRILSSYLQIQLPNLIISSFILCIILLYTNLRACEERIIFVSPTFSYSIHLKKHILFLDLMNIKTPRTKYFQTLQKKTKRWGGRKTKNKRTLKKIYFSYYFLN
jgi:hypothetical protein